MYEDDYDYDPLKKYDNTRRLYTDIAEYLGTCDIKTNTPTPIVAVHINICLRRFKRKPSEKVLYLCFKYLEKIGYDWDKNDAKENNKES